MLNDKRAILYVVQSLVASEDQLVSTIEAAKVLKVDRSVVTRLAATGALAVVISAPGRNGAKFYRRADVEALAEARGHAPASSGAVAASPSDGAGLHH